jgi:hypothetical protein
VARHEAPTLPESRPVASAIQPPPPAMNEPRERRPAPLLGAAVAAVVALVGVVVWASSSAPQVLTGISMPQVIVPVPAPTAAEVASPPPSSSASEAAVAPPPVPPPIAPRPAPPPSARCSPPYYFDDGIKRYKPECL